MEKSVQKSNQTHHLLVCASQKHTSVWKTERKFLGVASRLLKTHTYFTQTYYKHKTHHTIGNQEDHLHFH